MAPVHTQFEVVPTGTEWQIRRDGMEFLAVQTRQTAIDEVAAQAQRNQPCRVLVMALDGSVEEDATFGAGWGTPPAIGGRPTF